MFHLYTIIPLVVVLISSYYFNQKKLDESTAYIIMVSGFEGVISYLIIYLIFLEGFFTRFYQFLIVFLLIAIISYIFFLIERDLDNDMDLQIETIKNNLILYAITVAPFYIFLTVFRFEEPFLQILYSLLATSVIILIYVFLREQFNAFSEAIYLYFADATANIFLGIWAVTIVLIGLVFMFDFPINTIKEQFNLSDNVSYFTFDGFPTRLDNTFNERTELQFEVSKDLGSNLVDYYLDGSILYVYSDKDRLSVIDTATAEIIHSEKLEGVYEEGGLSFPQVTNLFFKNDDQLYLLSRSGLYILNDPTDIKAISPYKIFGTNIFYQDDKLFILRSRGLGLFHIYSLENDELILDSEIDANNHDDFTGLTVINKTLFKIKDEIYTAYDDEQYSFEFVHVSPIYDEDNHIMYYAYFSQETNETIYIQSSSLTNINEKTLVKDHNTYGITLNGYVFYVEEPDDSIGRIEIINQNFEFEAIINHQKHSQFWIGNQYYESYIVNYLALDDKLTYLQVDKNSTNTLLTLQVVEKLETGLSLPFYSFYGLFNFIPTLIFLFIPMSNYRTEITFIGFDQLLKKKKN